jgi:hypothetical protein
LDLDDQGKIALRVGPRVDDDYLTLAMLSAGLAGILRRRERAARGESQQEGLLPAPWRAAFARLWWRCQEQGVAPAETDLDLLVLCAQPFAAWPVALSLSSADMQESLLVGEELSPLAEQGARIGAYDVEAEWQERLVYQALRLAAEANGGGDAERTDQVYAALRRRLIDYPVVPDLTVLRWEREFDRVGGNGQTYVRRLIDVAYVSRPVTGNHEYLRCPSCRNTVADSRAVCGTPGCASGSAESVSVGALAVVHDQHRATRRFIHDPGLVEERLLSSLAGDKDLTGKVRITAYPALDALDILIEFLEGTGDHPRVTETWGADAKDQASARLLGRGFRWPEVPVCDRRLLVLPTHRAAEPGYVGDLTAELDGRVNGVEVVDEKGLVSQVKKRARRTGQ